MEEARGGLQKGSEVEANLTSPTELVVEKKVGDAGLPLEIPQSQAVAFLFATSLSLFAASDVRTPGTKVCNPNIVSWETEPIYFRTYTAVRWRGISAFVSKHNVAKG